MLRTEGRFPHVIVMKGRSCSTRWPPGDWRPTLFATRPPGDWRPTLFATRPPGVSGDTQLSVAGLEGRFPHGAVGWVGVGLPRWPPGDWRPTICDPHLRPCFRGHSTFCCRAGWRFPHVAVGWVGVGPPRGPPGDWRPTFCDPHLRPTIATQTSVLVRSRGWGITSVPFPRRCGLSDGRNPTPDLARSCSPQSSEIPDGQSTGH